MSFESFKNSGKVVEIVSTKLRVPRVQTLFQPEQASLFPAEWALHPKGTISAFPVNHSDQNFRTISRMSLFCNHVCTKNFRNTKM